MRRRVYRFVGVMLVGAAVAGLAISLAGIVGVWRIERRMKSGLANALALMDTTLQTTTDGLTIAGRSLDQADDSLTTLVVTIRTTGKSVSDTIPLLASLTQVTTQAVPTTVLATQAALESAQASAQVVDATLAVLTAIPLLPVAPYQPSVPLSQALADVSASLDAIPQSLSGMETALEKASANLIAMQGQLEAIAGDIEGISASLAEARTVTTQYLQVMATLQQQVQLARVNLPRQLDLIAWFVTVVMVWLGLTQVGLMLQGFEALRPNYMQRHERPPEPAPPARGAPAQLGAAAEPPPDAAPDEGPPR